MLSLAGQVHLGRDAVVSEQTDEDVGVGARSSLVPGDGHHLVHCTHRQFTGGHAGTAATTTRRDKTTC